jgi:hypothetical protein
MRLLQTGFGAALVWALAAGCTTKDSLLDQAGSGGAQGGTAGGKAGGAGVDSGSAGVSSSGRGGGAGAASAGNGNPSGAGNAVSGSSGEGGDGDRGGSQGAGTSGAGFGGAEAGSGGSDTAGAAGANCTGAACGACESIESVDDCEARTDCHSVFQDPGDCECPGIGCCASFLRCADGERADCTGANVMCEAPTPYCESPAYVVSYSSNCYEGCVAAKDCAPSPPTPCPTSVPTDGSACDGDTQCYYDACPEGGRAIASCSSRVWTVETGTSCAVACAGFSQQCSEGEVCLVHAGGAVLIECIANGCGTGPILAECAGNCPVSFSLSGGATATCNTCPQGGCP